MAVKYAMPFDDSALEQIRAIQKQAEKFRNDGLFAAIAQLQKELEWASRIDISPSVKALEALSHSMRDISPKMVDVLITAQKISETLAPITQELMAGNNWITEFIPSIDTSFRDAMAYSWDDLTQKGAGSEVLSFMEDFVSEELPEGFDAEKIKTISADERIQLAADINEAVGKKENWQQHLMAQIQEWKQQNPIVAVILCFIVSFLIQNYILSPVFSQIGQTIKSAVIREEPNASSAQVCQVEKDWEVVLIDDVPYYYQVEFDDPVTGERLYGFISKKTVRPVLSDDYDVPVGGSEVLNNTNGDTSSDCEECDVDGSTKPCCD